MLLANACATALAQTPPVGWAARTGDPWIDRQLADINAYARRYPDAFADELSRYYSAPRELVASLLREKDWTPGDIYYACALAQQVGQPCRSVAATRTRDPGQAWSSIGPALGVTPGSPALQRIKTGVRASYAHWARPIEPVEGGGDAATPAQPTATKAPGRTSSSAPAPTRPPSGAPKGTPAAAHTPRTATARRLP